MPASNTPTVLAIDYGTKRIGLAISRVGLAEPLKIVANSSKMFEQIKSIVATEEVDKIVVGLSEQDMAKKTRNFASQLAELVDPPVVFTDETLSSQTAQAKLKTSKKKTRTGPIDHFAAAQFLQEWLEVEQSN